MAVRPTIRDGVGAVEDSEGAAVAEQQADGLPPAEEDHHHWVPLGQRKQLIFEDVGQVRVLGKGAPLEADAGVIWPEVFAHCVHEYLEVKDVVVRGVPRAHGRGAPEDVGVHEEPLDAAREHACRLVRGFHVSLPFGL